MGAYRKESRRRKWPWQPRELVPALWAGVTVRELPVSMAVFGIRSELTESHRNLPISEGSEPNLVFQNSNILKNLIEN